MRLCVVYERLFYRLIKQVVCIVSESYTDSYRKKIMKASGHLYGSLRSQPLVRCDDEMFRMAETLS